MKSRTSSRNVVSSGPIPYSIGSPVLSVIAVTAVSGSSHL
jgi:hypothetical protein